MTQSTSTFSRFLAASRFHIVLIAFLATMTFSWLLSGYFGVLLALLVAVDWWILDVGNKISDLAEDLKNSPDEARWVEKNRETLGRASLVAFVVSLLAGALIDPWLIPLRIVFQLIGVGYNFKCLPLGGGRLTRFKDLYIGKNLSAGVLFVISVVGYPLIGYRDALLVSPSYIATMSLFFIFFEMSFEVIYDLKDILGDRAEGIRTFPAVHGPGVALGIVVGFVAVAISTILFGYLSGILGFRELIILLAPALQLATLPPYQKRGFLAADTVWITHLGSAQLAIYLAYAWLELPIPPWG